MVAKRLGLASIRRNGLSISSRSGSSSSHTCCNLVQAPTLLQREMAMKRHGTASLGSSNCVPCSSIFLWSKAKIRQSPVSPKQPGRAFRPNRMSSRNMSRLYRDGGARVVARAMTSRCQSQTKDEMALPVLACKRHSFASLSTTVARAGKRGAKDGAMSGCAKTGIIVCTLQAGNASTRLTRVLGCLRKFPMQTCPARQASSSLGCIHKKGTRCSADPVRCHHRSILGGRPSNQYCKLLGPIHATPTAHQPTTGTRPDAVR